MKWIGIILITILFAGAGMAQTIEGSALVASLAKYDPSPAIGGRPMTIWFDVLNKGFDPSDEVTFTIEPTYPFTSADGILTKTYDRIGSRDSIRIEFRLLVDRDVRNTTGLVKLRYATNGAEFKKDFNVTVAEDPNNDNRDPADLKALYVRSSPAPYIGGTSSISFDIVNAQKGTAYYVIAQASSPAATIDRNEIFVGTLESNDFDSVDFDVKIKNDIEPGMYPMTVTTIYKDIDSNEIIKNSTIELNILPASAGQASNATPWWMYLIYLLIIAAIVKFIVLPRFRKK